MVGWVNPNAILMISLTPRNDILMDKKVIKELKPLWSKMKKALDGTNLSSGPADLLLDRKTHQSRAENSIKALALLSPLAPSKTVTMNSQELWASDGSMHPANAGPLEEKIITSVITRPKTLVLRIRDNMSSILQGELMGMIATTILATPSSQKTPYLFTDHLNTVRLIDDHRAGQNTTVRL